MVGAHFAADADVVARKVACDVGKMEHGCEHYRRRCKIVAPCCNEVFPCRHCHNEATALGDRHDIPRQDVAKVVCVLCDTKQPVSQVCICCGVNMGEYFCSVCKFYDDDTVKGQYHCHDCGICRVGGQENYFHCATCGSCYAVSLHDNHQCVEDSMRQNCPICYEYLFDSLKGTRVLDCGHTMHMDCFAEMVDHNKYTCPICSKTALDMTLHWDMLDREIEATIMPTVYNYKELQEFDSWRAHELEVREGRGVAEIGRGDPGRLADGTTAAQGRAATGAARGRAARGRGLQRRRRGKSRGGDERGGAGLLHEKNARYLCFLDAG